MTSTLYKDQSALYRFSQGLCVALGLGLLFYTFYRAATLSFTHDEAYTFNRFFTARVTDVLINKYPTANNHILNTILMMALGKMMGPSEFVLRLPNLLAHMVYLYFSLKLVQRFPHWLLILCGFILLNVNTYLLDFFSVGRGYGLSLAFMMAAIYHLVRHMKEKRKGLLNRSLILLFFGVLSNFTLLHLITAFWLALLLDMLYPEELSTREKIMYFIQYYKRQLIFTLIYLLLIAYPLRQLLVSGELYYGGQDGFWGSTITTLGLSMAYMQPYIASFLSIVMLFFRIVIFAGSSLVLYSIIRPIALEGFRYYRALYILMVIPALMLVLQHAVLGSPFVINRTGLFFWPLAVLNLLYILSFFRGSSLRWVGWATTVAFSGFMVFHFQQSGNLRYYLEWRYDASNKAMLTELEKNYKPANGDTLQLGTSWIFEPSINYYRKVRQLDWLAPVHREGPAGEYPIYYIEAQEKEKVPAQHQQVIKEYPVTGNLLIK